MAIMALVQSRGGFLYQHRPDLFPQGFMTDEEMSLWAAYHLRRGKETARG